MRAEIQPWHSIVLQTYQAQMFDTLIHTHNITTETSKSYQFENTKGEILDELRGFFAIKNTDGQNKKYFIEETYYPSLPVRVNSSEEIFYKDSSRSRSVILKPTNVTPFKIKPEKCWDNNKTFMDLIAPFQHTRPDHWTLNKIIAVMSYVGKTFCGISSKSEFGKSSIYLILDSITKKLPVFQPRSVPGILVQITHDGNMVFDEVHDPPAEVKKCMENFSLQVAGNSPIYINGAMKAKNTKAKYDVSQQSITYLYNIMSNYSDPDKQFWNRIWSNTKAMESRFLLLKLEGKLLEEFDKDFNIVEAATQNKMMYIRIAKHLLYLKHLKLTNQYKRKFIPLPHPRMNGRHKIVYDEITWGIDLYAQVQSEYDHFVKILNDSITNYAKMLGGQMTSEAPIKFQQYETEEVTDSSKELSDEDKILNAFKTSKATQLSLEEIESLTNIKDIDNKLADLLTTGKFFQPQAGYLQVLK